MSNRLNRPSRKEQTHERIVGVAARAIRRAGFNGVGVADIMKEAGLTHGGFYAHFESREALLVEALQRASRDGGAALAEHVVAREAAGESRFKAFVDAYLGDAQLDDIEGGCVVAALCADTPRQSEAVRAEGQRRVLAIVNAVRAALPSGAAGAAEVVTATLVGAIQLARALGGDAGRALLARTRGQLLETYEASSHSG